MLVASGPIASAALRIGQHRRSYRRFRTDSSREQAVIAPIPVGRPVPSGGWFRSRRIFPFHLAVPRPVPCRFTWAFVPPGRSHAFRLPFPATVSRPSGCAPLTASAVRQALSEDFARRVFRRCCGHRCLCDRFSFPLLFQRVTAGTSDRFLRSTHKSCASKVSRASTNFRTYPQTARFNVDNLGDCHQWLGFCAAQSK